MSFFSICPLAFSESSVNKNLYLYYIFNCHLAAPQPTSGHYWGYSLTHPMLITAFVNCCPKSWVSRPTQASHENLGVEIGAFQFLCNAFTHSATLPLCPCYFISVFLPHILTSQPFWEWIIPNEQFWTPF